MRLIEFAKLCNIGCCIEVRSGYNGKLLCTRFREDKHGHIAEREVISCWPDIRAKDGFARAVMCVYVHGLEELEMEMKKNAAD